MIAEPRKPAPSAACPALPASSCCRGRSRARRKGRPTSALHPRHPPLPCGRMIGSSPHVRPPQQQRSRESFERVLEAAVDLLETEGYAGFTLAEVSRRARVSIGSIYARVSSKDDLFYAIHERVMAQIGVENEVFSDLTRWQGLPTRRLVMEAVRELAEPFRAHAEIL